jgi:hypothetical protein
VTSTDPIWFYCSTPSHCQSGMAGVVNPPSSGSDTLANYIAAAAMTTSSEADSKVQGGSIVPVGTLPSSSAGSSSAAPASSVTAGSSTLASSVASSVATGATSVSGGATAPASSTSATPTTAAKSGASGPQGSIFAAQGTLAGLAVGLGLFVFFMS